MLNFSIHMTRINQWMIVLMHTNIQQTRKLSEIIRNALIKKHNNSKGYKAKDPISTVHVIMKFHSHKTVKMLQGGGPKKKLNDRCLQWLVWIVENTPHKTSKEQADQSGWPGPIETGGFICHMPMSRGAWVKATTKNVQKGKTDVCKHLG